MCADVLVGILAIGQEEHTHLCRPPSHRRKGAQGRLLSRRITVITEDDARCTAQEECCVAFRKRCAERCNNVRHSCLPCGYRVHIALDDNRRALGRNRTVCAIQPKEELAFVKDGGLRRI